MQNVVLVMGIMNASVHIHLDDMTAGQEVPTLYCEENDHVGHPPYACETQRN